MREKKAVARTRRLKHLDKEPAHPTSQFEYHEWTSVSMEVYGVRYPRQVIATSLAKAPVVG